MLKVLTKAREAGAMPELSAAPDWLYWVLLVVGVATVAVGISVAQCKTGSTLTHDQRFSRSPPRIDSRLNARLPPLARSHKATPRMRRHRTDAQGKNACFRPPLPLRPSASRP